MMKTKPMGFVALVSITLSMTAVVGTLGVIAPIPNEATAQQQQGNQEFDALLTGAAEVPPVQTSASGFAELEAGEEGSDNMEYDIIVINIDKVTMAHIHQGSSTEAGPVIVTLFNASTSTGAMIEELTDGTITVATLFNASTPTGPMTGELTDGTITSANLEGPLQGKQLSDLIALIQNGQAYVNVHTEQNPEGEIRGTIVADQAPEVETDQS